MKNEKTDEIHCTEIKNEILLLHERWEKLEKLSQRLHKRYVVLLSERGIFYTDLVKQSNSVDIHLLIQCFYL